MRGYLLIWFCLMVTRVMAQQDSTQHFKFSGFTDIYFAYDFNNPKTHERANFLYNHNRHNEFNVNLALLKMAYTADKIRGNVAIMAGTYAQYNLVAEQDLLRNIYEANAGFRIGKDLWLDAGIFPSHIGLEGAISKDNYTLTRSLAAENSPYYESGAKITYTKNKWVLTGLVLNGWQNIREPAGNSNKALGTQVQFKPTSAIVLNSSSFIGNEKPDSTKQMRYFHDFYATFQIHPRFGFAVLFDIGAEKRAAAAKYNVWYCPTLLLRYACSDKIALAARGEYYQDANGVIITPDLPLEFKTSGYSLNLDYAPVHNLLLRIEGRLLNSKGAIFRRNNLPTDKSTTVTSSMAISF